MTLTPEQIEVVRAALEVARDTYAYGSHIPGLAQPFKYQAQRCRDILELFDTGLDDN